MRTQHLRSLLVAFLVSVTAAAAYGDLIAHWPLDDDGSDIVGGHDGVVPDRVEFDPNGANANTGGAADFLPGEGGIQAEFADELNPDDDFSVTAWVNPVDTAGWNSVVTSREDNGSTVNGFIIYNSPDNQWDFWTGGEGATGQWVRNIGSDAILEEWTHLAVTYNRDDDTKILYVNGEEDAVFQGPPTVDQNTTYNRNSLRPFNIGAGEDTGSNFFFQGLIDDVSVWDNTLSQSDIQSIAQNGVTGFIGGGGGGGLQPDDEALVGIWLFDEGEGDAVGDSSPNGNDGEIFPGIDDYVWDQGKFGSAIVAPGDGSIDVQDSDSLATIVEELTVAGWFRIDEDSDTGVRKNGAYLLEDQSDGEPIPDGFSFRIWTDQGLSPGIYGQTELPQGEWVHLAGTYDGEIMELYINGEPESEQGLLDSDGGDVDPAWGGDISTGETLQLKFGSETLFGGVDEVAIYNRALSQSEVQDLMGGYENLGAGGAVQLQAGDADQDLDFDQLDLVQVLARNKYLTGEAATWGDGDWNAAPGGAPGNPPAGDGFFNQGDIIAALNADKYLKGPYAALVAEPVGELNDDQTTLVYDTTSGNLSVNAPVGKELTSINVDSAGGKFIGDKPGILDGAFDNFDNGNIFKATFGGSFGSVGFGAVLPAGLSSDELKADLTAVGSLNGGGDLGPVDLIWIPEPTALVLLSLGLAGMLATRRRRRD